MMDNSSKDSSPPDSKIELVQPPAPVSPEPVKVERHDDDTVLPEVVSPEVEKRLLRKLDIRIVPMVMWIYLMNFMDRGVYLLFPVYDGSLTYTHQ